MQLVKVMTDYVATRWYRAPELLLNTTKYDGSGLAFNLKCVCEY